MTSINLSHTLCSSLFFTIRPYPLRLILYCKKFLYLRPSNTPLANDRFWSYTLVDMFTETSFEAPFSSRGSIVGSLCASINLFFEDRLLLSAVKKYGGLLSSNFSPPPEVSSLLPISWSPGFYLFFYYISALFYTRICYQRGLFQDLK